MVYKGFPGYSDGKASTCNAEDPGLIPKSGRSPEGNGNPLQRIPWTEEPGWLEYMGCKELDMTEQLIHAHGLYGLREWLKGKESVCNAGDTGDMCSIPGFRSSPGVGHGNPLRYSCLENPMDREAW